MPPHNPFEIMLPQPVHVASQRETISEQGDVLSFPSFRPEWLTRRADFLTYCVSYAHWGHIIREKQRFCPL